MPRGDIVVVHWARRTQGLLLAPGNPLGIGGLEDVARRGLRLARRGEGSGSQVLLEALLARAGLALAAMRTAERVAETQGDLAGMIAMGEADCGLGVAAAAAGLDFLPLWPDEEFDLVLRRRDYFEAPVQAVLAFARSEAFAPAGRVPRRLRHRAARRGALQCLTREAPLRAQEVATAAPLSADAALSFIGTVRTPWTRREDCPRQGSSTGRSAGWCSIRPGMRRSRASRHSTPSRCSTGCTGRGAT